MMNASHTASRRALAFAELLDIPDSHYELATDRYRSFYDCLIRPGSTVAEFGPAVYSQGSFRYGTVIRPLFKRDEYDLDAVAELVIGKMGSTQRQVKLLLGGEVRSHAEAYRFKSPPEEKHRCWRLDYADAVKFHMDLIPVVPEDEDFKQLLVRGGVDPRLARLAVAITDRRHPNYEVQGRE